jgi:hypothetical protein
LALSYWRRDPVRAPELGRHLAMEAA